MKSKSYSHTHNGYGSESTSGSNSPSPPPSPPRNLTVSASRRRLFRSKSQSMPRLESLIAAILLRRNLRYLVLLSLLYVSGLVMCVGPFSVFVFQPSPPGSVYRSHELFRMLWGDIQSDNSSALEMSTVWNYKTRLKQQNPCPNVTTMQHPKIEAGSSGSSGSIRYLIVEANGGLNQQRSAICNAVALAGFLNAILVIPHLEFNSVWRDTSVFGDIFDEDHFTTMLNGYVQVIKQLPDKLMERYDYNISNMPNIRVPAWASVKYYSSVVYPILQKEGVIRIAPFANRLAMSVPPQVQFLRCLANYRALQFSPPISGLAKKLASRMVEKSARNGGKYVSVHLRFEKDMVAFSCCVYDGGRAEKYEMDLVRETSWRGKFKRTDRVISPGLNRIDGKCPLTPLEVGMMLRGMGFDNNTSIYLASGKIYQEERHLAPLLKMFPLLHTKESLATPEELAPFMGYSSRLAALDYTVCLLSEVFVTTQGGNFPHFLMGHRRFLYDGHAKTIRPDKREFAILLQDMSISWNAFKDRMKVMLTDSDRNGIMIPRVKKFNRKTSIYTYPLPECSCLQQPHNSTFNLIDTVNSPVSQLKTAR